MTFGAAWLLAGNVAYALAQWGVVVTIARLGSVAEQGAYSYVLAVLAPLTMLLRFNLRAVLSTDHHDEFRYEEYYVARLFGTMAPVLLVVLIVCALSGDGSIALMAGCIGVLKAAEGLSDIAYGQLQREQSLRKISVLMIARATTLLAVFLVGFLMHGEVWYLALIVAVFWLAIHLGFEPRIPKLTELADALQRSRSTVIGILKKCWPLGISMSLVALFNYIPLFFLEAHSDLTVVGAFAAVNYVWLIGVFLATSISQAIAATMARYFHEDIKKYLKHLGLTMVVLVVLGVGITIPINSYSNELVVLVYGDKYQGLGPILEIISMAIVINVLLAMLGLNLTIARAFRSMLVMNILSVIVIIGFASVLIPEMLATGAALALVAGLLVKLLLSSVLSGVILKQRWAASVSSGN